MAFVNKPVLHVERVVSMEVSVEMSADGQSLTIRRGPRTMESLNGSPLPPDRALPEGVLDDRETAEASISLRMSPENTKGLLGEAIIGLSGVNPPISRFQIKDPEGKSRIRGKIMRKLVMSASGITKEDLSWYRRASRKVRDWFKMVDNDTMQSYRTYTHTMWNLSSGSAKYEHGLCTDKFGGDLHSLKGYKRFMIGLLSDLQPEARRWFRVDTDRLTPVQLVEYLGRVCEKMDPVLLHSYTSRSSLHYQSYRTDALLNQRRYQESLVAARSLLGEHMKVAAACSLWSNTRPVLAGALWSMKIPDTPWHALLSSEANVAYSTNAYGVRNIEYRDIRTCDLVPWSAVSENQVVRWVTEASYTDAIKILGWEHFSHDVVGPEQDLIDGNVGWGHQLSGWHPDVEKSLGSKRKKEEKGEEADLNLEIGYADRYHYLLGDNFIGPNFGDRWITLSDIVSECFKYIADGKIIADKYADKTAVDEHGRTVKVQPIKGSFRRMLKDAKYNHNVERLFMAAAVAVDTVTGEPVDKTSLWVPGPEDGQLPIELESKRVTTKEQLMLLGKKLNHCVGGRAAPGRLFYNDGTVVAEVDFKAGSVSECRDARNKITENSRKLTGELTVAFPNKIKVLGLNMLPHCFAAQVKDWETEYYHQFPDRVWGYTGQEDVGVYIKVTGCGFDRDIAGSFPIPHQKSTGSHPIDLLQDILLG